MSLHARGHAYNLPRRKNCVFARHGVGAAMSTRPKVKFKSLMPHSKLLKARKKHEYDKEVDQHAVGPKTVPQEGLNQHHHRQQLYSEAP